MKRSRFSEEKIIGVLKEHEAGAKVDELCRRHGISSATFYTLILPRESGRGQAAMRSISAGER